MMNEDTRKVLSMLAEGKISQLEAEQLLDAMDAPAPKPNGESPSAPKTEPKSEPRFFRILVTKAAHDGAQEKVVNIRVPITVVRGGLRLGSLFPGVLAKKKIFMRNGAELDLSKISAEDLEGLIKDFGEISVEVNGGAEHVSIRCE